MKRKSKTVKSRVAATRTPAAKAAKPARARGAAVWAAGPAASANAGGARRAAPGKVAAAAASAPRALPERLPRDPKGGRAQFYQDPAIDQLWAVVTALTAEVSVAFDRLDTVERLLERDGRVTRASIEAWRPDEAATNERAQRREELIARVFQVLGQYGG